MKLHRTIIVDQRNTVFLQSEVKRHRVRFPVRDHLWMENDNDVREGDFPDFVDGLV